MVEKTGKYGSFIACSNYPNCKNILKEDKKPPVETKEVCETRLPDGQECGGKMVIRSGRFGDFLACSNYPKCKNTKKKG